MKKTIVTITLGLITTVTFGQTDTSKKEDQMSKKMPPMSMLPKPGKEKQIYELPKVCEYKVYNKKGKLIEEKTGQFIDVTKYKKGTYFVKYEGETETFECK